MSPLRIWARAIDLWWRELIVWTIFNVVWFALQIPIVTGPPATAAMFVIARRVAAGEYVDFRDGVRALREMFIPAWQWGMITLILIVVIGGNLWFYQTTTGLQWDLLRIVWIAIGLVWFTASLFFWPFWLAQADRRVSVTLRNVALFIAQRPGLALILALSSLVVAAASTLVTLPLVVALMSWLSLLGTVAVNDELHRIETRQAA
ncbi:hypothetical protein TFLX_02678 [Thermoflexales bacterium]|nr:hypothetical protein TFLX_02678 [Thermoflexales bacterium]